MLKHLKNQFDKRSISKSLCDTWNLKPSNLFKRSCSNLAEAIILVFFFPKKRRQQLALCSKVGKFFAKKKKQTVATTLSFFQKKKEEELETFFGLRFFLFVSENIEAYLVWASAIGLVGVRVSARDLRKAVQQTLFCCMKAGKLLVFFVNQNGFFLFIFLTWANTWTSNKFSWISNLLMSNPSECCTFVLASRCFTTL